MSRFSLAGLHRLSSGHAIPETKPKSGVTYKFYRCADGKRVHRDRKQAQVNVREEAILDRLGEAVDAIVLTPDVADAIAQGLNETHRTAMAAKARHIEAYAAEIRELEHGEDELFDQYKRGDFDVETYNKQVKRVRQKKQDRLAQLAELNKSEDEKYLVTAARVLELAKNARSLWEGRQPSDKRDLLERLVCNPRLDGRTVRYDLKKPFNVLAKMRGVDGWHPYVDEFRTALIELAAAA